MLRAIIIDDEVDGLEALRLSIEKFCPNIELIAACEDAKSGLAAIQTQQPDIVFLDVQMPYMSGFDLLNELDEINFEVIFVTAYNQYAIKAIKFSALDYLLKPVEIDDLLSAVNRAEKRRHKINRSVRYESFIENVKSDQSGIGKLAIPTMEGLVFVNISEVIYCKSEGNYTFIQFVKKKNMLVSRTLKEFEDILSEHSFYRVHNSYLINLKHIQKFVRGAGGYIIMTDGYTANVSRRKREEFLSIFSQS